LGWLPDTATLKPNGPAAVLLRIPLKDAGTGR
jgi:hypothetical protein